MSGRGSYTSRSYSEEVVLPMGVTEQQGTLQYHDAYGNPTGTTISADISAQIYKNFFFGREHYTCYRRNYMACICSYELTPYFPGVQIHFTPMGSVETLPIVGFAMSVTACVSTDPHQDVIILQHTSKRNKGPIAQPGRQSLAPKNKQTLGTPPYMCGNFHEAAQVARPILPTEHNFDRIQFKTATANNGQRNARNTRQQCYQMVVELWGDLGPGNPNRRWAKLAIQRSCEVVVRGRSPMYYQEKRRENSGSGGGSGPSLHGNYDGSDYSTFLLVYGSHPAAFPVLPNPLNILPR